MELNARPSAARTVGSVVHVEVVEGRLRPIRNITVKAIDLKLSQMGHYEKLDLLPFMRDLQSWERWRAMQDLKKGMPSGCIEHWSWMP